MIVPNNANASAPLPAAMTVTVLAGPVVSDVTARKPPTAVTVAPLMAVLKMVAQLVALLQSPLIDTGDGLFPSTPMTSSCAVTKSFPVKLVPIAAPAVASESPQLQLPAGRNSQAVLTPAAHAEFNASPGLEVGPESAESVPNSALMLDPLVRSTTIELAAPTVLDVITRLLLTVSTVAPEMAALRDAAQFAAVSQFPAKEIVETVPPSTEITRFWAAERKSCDVNVTPVNVPAVAAVRSQADPSPALMQVGNTLQLPP
jgi:hypothetical protein